MFPWSDTQTVQPATYAVGNTCRNGHAAGRDKRGECIQCRRDANKKYRDANSERRNSADRKRYAMDPTLAKERERRRYEKDFIKIALKSARKRAAERNFPYDITENDVHVPMFCPVFGTELKIGKGRPDDASPSLDKIIPALGYVRGNVWVISHRANRIKSDASLEDLEKLTAVLKKRREFPWQT